MMSLWLSFVLIAVLNLALGVATAIYFRRYIDILRTTPENSGDGNIITRIQTSDGESPPESAASNQVSLLSKNGSSPNYDREESPGATDDISDPENGDGRTDQIFDGPEVSETLPTGESQQNGEIFAAGVSSQGATSVAPHTHDAPTDEESSRPTGTTEAQESTLSPASFGLGSLDDSASEVDALSTDEPSSSPVLQLLRQTDSVIDQLRHLHDQLFGQSPVDREALASLLSGVEPIIEELIGEYHQVLPDIVNADSNPPPDEILSHLHEQVLALQQAEVRLTSIDLRGDFHATLKEVQGECSRVLGSVHGLRDALEAVYAHETATSDAPPALTSPVCFDPLTGLFNRVGLERFLQTHTLTRLARDRLTAVLFDLDQFARVNQRFGHRLGDQTLAAIAKVFQQASLRQATWVRYGGDQFLLLLRETDARQGVQHAEQLRQHFEVAQFAIANDTVHLTLSAAVTELRNDDTSTTIFLRLLETLKKAKRAGGNRTFVHNGQEPSPVVPPNLQVEEKTYQVFAPTSAAEQAAAVEEAFRRG